MSAFTITLAAASGAATIAAGVAYLTGRLTVRTMNAAIAAGQAGAFTAALISEDVLMMMIHTLVGIGAACLWSIAPANRLAPGQTRPPRKLRPGQPDYDRIRQLENDLNINQEP